MPSSDIVLLEIGVEHERLKEIALWHATALGFQPIETRSATGADGVQAVLASGPLRIVLAAAGSGKPTGVHRIGCCVSTAGEAYERALACGVTAGTDSPHSRWSTDESSSYPSVGLPGGVLLQFIEHVEMGSRSVAETEVLHIDHVAFVTRSGEARRWAQLLLSMLGGELIESSIDRRNGESSTGWGRMFQVRPACGTSYVFVEPLTLSSKRANNHLSDYLVANGGPGLQHVAFATSSIHERGRRMAEAGTPFLSPEGDHYKGLLKGGMDEQTVGILKSLSLVFDPDPESPLWQGFTEWLSPGTPFFYEFIQATEYPARLRQRNVDALFQSAEKSPIEKDGGDAT